MSRPFSHRDTARGGESSFHQGEQSAATDASRAVSLVADEPTGSIAPGGTVSGVINSSGDVDQFTISLVAGQTYSISLKGTGDDPLADAFLTLSNSGGIVVAGDDDGGQAHDALLTFTATATGTYTIAAEGYPGDGLAGGYTLDVRQMGTDSVGSTIASAQAINVGETTFGFVERSRDIDMYAVTLTEGTFYSIELAGGADYETDPNAVPAGELDTRVTIYDASGNPVASNDDVSFPDDLSSSLSFSPDATGTYYIKVDAYPRQTGGFTLEVNELDLSTLDPLDSIDWGTQLATSNVTVYFAAAGESFDGVTSLGWSAYEIQQAMAAFQTYADVSNLTFTITNNSATATFKLVTTNSSEFLGYFNPPGETNAGVGVFAVNGDGWDTTGGLEPGGYGWITLVHEFGHGLGLAHPHDDGGTSEVMAGVTAPFDSFGVFDLNQGVYTTMSYNDGWQLHPGGTSASLNYGWQAGPSAFDIALIQIKYGAAAANTGDNVYVFPTSNAAGTFWDVIWDTGGVDTVAHTGLVSATIDLTAATLDYSPTGAGVISYVDGIFGGFTIAAGVVIENATGGSGADVLIGNQAANVLDGGAGDDTLQGNGGTDTFLFDVGDGMDTVTDLASGETVEISGYTSAQSITQDGTNVVVVLSASDRITFQNTTVVTVQTALQFPDNTGNVINGTDGDDPLVGTSEVDTINGFAGNDTIDGLAGNDTLNGGAGNDVLDGGAGADTMSGGTGNDTFRVNDAGDVVIEAAGEGEDAVRAAVSYALAAGASIEILSTKAETATTAIDLTGNELDNRIYGNAGTNVLDGAAGNDRLYGNAGNDTLNGAAGNDVLDGGLGADTMSGGTGNDIFKVNDAGDVVVEAAGQGEDAVRATVSYTLPDGASIEILSTKAESGTAAIDLTGNELGNRIYGNAGTNVLNGAAGNDRLYGNAGNDTLVGGAGADQLTGGTGNDRFVFNSAADSTLASPDQILDFASGDTIDLAGIDANSALADDQAFTFIGSSAFNNTAGELRYEIVSGTTYVYGDTNGDGIADFQIVVTTGAALVGGDFVI